MKVLHILNEIKPSGAETMLESAASMWGNSRIELHVLSTGNDVGNYVENLKKEGFIVHHLAFEKFALLPKISFILKLYKLIKEINADVIHIHPERGNFTYAIVSKLAGCRKIIRTVHHIFPQPKTIPWQIIRYIRVFQRKILINVLNIKFFSNSYSGQQNELKEYFVNHEIIPNWFNSNKYILSKKVNKNTIRKKFGVGENTLLFVSIGGNWPYKNYKNIIEAFSILKNKNDILYFQVGLDSKNELRPYVDRLGISNIVKILGVIDDIDEYLISADILLMPSTEEGFGISAVEAMGMGTAVVLSDKIALSDFKNYTDQVIWTGVSSKEIAATISHVVETYDRKKLENIGKKLSDDIHKHFGIENGAKKYLEEYCK